MVSLQEVWIDLDWPVHGSKTVSNSTSLDFAFDAISRRCSMRRVYIVRIFGLICCRVRRDGNFALGSGTLAEVAQWSPDLQDENLHARVVSVSIYRVVLESAGIRLVIGRCYLFNQIESVKRSTAIFSASLQSFTDDWRYRPQADPAPRVPRNSRAKPGSPDRTPGKERRLGLRRSFLLAANHTNLHNAPVAPWPLSHYLDSTCHAAYGLALFVLVPSLTS